MTNSDKPVIFISCGQYSGTERQLGDDICRLIEELRPDLEPYFAQNQSSVDGLSDNILKALHDASGIVCLMHERGEVFHGEKRVATRGSVWIEQEIAIAAFIARALDREIPILFYSSPRITREGIRDKLHLNPMEFTSEAEVLGDLRERLPQMKFERRERCGVEPELEHTRATKRPEPHDYMHLKRMRELSHY